jgi:hypothetical protein
MLPISRVPILPRKTEKSEKTSERTLIEPSTDIEQRHIEIQLLCEMFQCQRMAN